MRLPLDHYLLTQERTGDDRRSLVVAKRERIGEHGTFAALEDCQFPQFFDQAMWNGNIYVCKICGMQQWFRTAMHCWCMWCNRSTLHVHQQRTCSKIDWKSGEQHKERSHWLCMKYTTLALYTASLLTSALWASSIKCECTCWCSLHVHCNL